jgi:hypothetical protein
MRSDTSPVIRQAVLAFFWLVFILAAIRVIANS